MNSIEQPQDHAGTGATGRPRLVRPLRPYLRQVAGLLAVGSAAGIVMNTAVVLPSVLLGHAIDTVSAHAAGKASAHAVTVAVLLLIGGAAATEVPRIGKRYWLGVARARIRTGLRADALAGVLSWPAERLHTTAVGEVMARIIGDVEVVGTGMGEIITETWDTLLFSASLITAMLIYSPALGLAAIAPVPVALLVAKTTGRAVARRTVAARKANAELTGFVQEGLTGLRVLRVSGRAPAWAERMNVLASAQAEAELSATRLQSVLAPIYTTLTGAGVIAVLWYGGHQVASGRMSVGDLVAFLALFARFTARAYRIPRMANLIQAAAAAHTRLIPLLAPPPPRENEPALSSFRTHRIPGQPTRPRPRPSITRTGPASVEVEHVVFTYPGAAAPALDGVSARIPAGGMLAVTGPVGSGKSALARLVAGLYPPEHGRVLVDGADPHAFTADQRAALGYLPQGHPVFSGTITENVRLTDTDTDTDTDIDTDGGHTPDRLAAALETAGLGPDIAAMPEGAATSIGELGVRISGGQRQRVALARALAAPAAPPRLLILDDPFSALDVETEARVITALREAVGPNAPAERRATILLCSTRLAAFPYADQILVLEHGRIAEHGSHTELLEAGGLYARIFHAQHRIHTPTPTATKARA